MRDELELGDVLVDIGVGVAKGAHAQEPADGEWGLLRLGALRSQVFGSTQAKRLQAWDSAYEKLEIRELDVLMVRVNGAPALVGATCVARGVRPRLVLSDLMYRLVPDERKVSPEFLGLLLNAENVRRQIRTAMRGTSGQFQLPQAEARSLRIPDVPLSQQRRIVAVHAVFERRIGALERLHDKLATVKRASLASELSAGSAHGIVPLRHLLDAVQSGWSPVCDSVPPALDEHGVLRLSAVTSGTFVPEEAKRLPSGVVARSALEVSAGDVLVSRANGVKTLVGVSCYVEQVRAGLYLPDLVFRLSPNPEQLDPRFLSLVLGSGEMRRQIDSVMRGTSGQYKISKEDIQRLSIPAVPLSEQRRIAAVQSGFECRSRALRKQAAKLRVAQQSVVEDLIRGTSLAHMDCVNFETSEN
ncbi:hypothetical protein AB0P41_16665 [Streptomyces sp. NPDC079167]|uniref:hypothetical protein n=1 Tax=Streptomyces sp. NPDC079167 TaxID=3154513 RepID=UPI00342D42B2